MSQPEMNYSSSRGKPRSALYRPSRDDGDRGRGSRRQQRHGEVQSVQAPPTILLKTRAQEPQARSLSPAPAVLHQLSEPVASTNQAKVSGKKDSNSLVSSGQQLTGTAPPAMTSPVKILNEDLSFQDSLHEFLCENSDYLVVGCVGLQWSGKSSVLSHLAASK